MKKAVCYKSAIFFAALFMLIVCMVERVSAAEALICEGGVTDIEGNACGTLHYEIYSDGTMVITGRGQGASYRPFGTAYDEKRPWHEFRAQIKQVVFECVMEGAADYSIGRGASINGWFVDCANLESVVGIPSGITDMSAAFLNCSSLTYVEKIPATVKTLQFTFKNCSSMVSAPELPPYLEDDYLTEFPGNDPQLSEGLLCTFEGCESLAYAPVIPSNTALYKLRQTFLNCANLTEIREIPENITCFQATFSGCADLRGVMYIRASELRLIDNVFGGAAENNPYIFFIRTVGEGSRNKIMNSIEEPSRIYAWDGEFRVNFMVLNSLNNSWYLTGQRNLNLRYGTQYRNKILEDYRSYITENYGNIYTIEYMDYGVLPTPIADGYVFEGWYCDAEYTEPVDFEQLVNPSSYQLKAHEITLYAKMRYVEEKRILTINPNGGSYKGNKTVYTARAFKNMTYTKSFSYTGSMQSYRLPLDGDYKIQVYGAQGGRYEMQFGGFGGNLSGYAKLEKGTMLYINVGGGGQGSNHEYAAGGYNGGGDSIKEYIRTYYNESSGEWEDKYDCCAGGGGASDVRVHSPNIESRIMVAGGGGGAGPHNGWNCRVDRPDLPNICIGEGGAAYEVYNRTIEEPNGQGGTSAAGGGGGKRGGAHSDTGGEEYAKLNSAYGGTNWYEPSVVRCLADNYFAWGEDSYEEYGKNGLVTISYTGALLELDTPVREGYVFAGWEVEGDGAVVDNIVLMGTGNMLLTADWTPADYEICFDAMGGTVPFTSMKYWNGYVYGKFGDFPSADKPGCAFLGWYTKPVGGERVTEGRIADTTGTVNLYAHYEARRIKVSFYSGDGSKCEPIVLEWGQPYGGLPIPHREGFLFLGWKYKEQDIDCDTIMKESQDHVLLAVWKCIIPPDIGMTGDSDGWRNTPLPVNTDIRDRSGEGLKSIIVTVVDSRGEEKTVISESYERGECSDHKLSFTVGNVRTKEYEGITKWNIAVSDYCDSCSTISFEAKLDFTPPVISLTGEGKTVVKEYLDSELIRQSAGDALSGMTEFYLIPASMQSGVWNSALVKRISAAPYDMSYNTDRKELKNEAAYILYATDRAGNRAEKIVFTKISVNNTVVRTVPPENYRTE